MPLCSSPARPMTSLPSGLAGCTRMTTESARDAEMNSTSRRAMNSSTAQCSRSLTSCTAASLRSARLAVGVVDVEQHDEVRRPRVEAEEGQAAGDLLLVEVAGDELVEEVAGQALLGLGDGLLLDQLERGHRHHVVQDDAVVLAEVAAVLDHGEERPDAVRGDHGVHLHARSHAGDGEGEVLAVGAAVADAAPQVGDQLGAQAPAVGGLAEHHAVEVEEHRRAADEGRERGEDGLEALLFEHDLGELLVHGQAALEQGVLLVDDLRGHRLGDGDERHVVRHLEQGEAVLLGHADQGRRHLVEAEAGAEPEAGDVVVDEHLEERDLVLFLGREPVPGGEQQLPALEPAGGVGDLGDVHPAHGVARGLGAREQAQVEVGNLEDVLNGDHGGEILHDVQVGGQHAVFGCPLGCYVLDQTASLGMTLRPVGGARAGRGGAAGDAPARRPAAASGALEDAAGKRAGVLAVGDDRHAVDEHPVEALGVAVRDVLEREARAGAGWWPCRGPGRGRRGRGRP